MLVTEFSDFFLTTAGVMTMDHPTGEFKAAHCQLNRDVSTLFPYINASFAEAKYYETPEYIQFYLNDIRCNLFPNHMIAGSFSDQRQALDFIQTLIGYLNDLHENRHAITPDHSRFKPISVIDIYKILPRTNCGACGFSSCLAFAAMLSRARVHPEQCPDLGPPIKKNVEYPVYDAAGNLSATVVITVDPTPRPPDGPGPAPGEGRSAYPSRNPGSDPGRTAAFEDLTDREIQVLRLAAEGATNTEISGILSISRHTVKSHMDHIFNKLGVNDRTQAAVWATRHRII